MQQVGLAGMDTEEPARVAGWGVSCVFVLDAGDGAEVERKVVLCKERTVASSLTLPRWPVNPGVWS